MFEPEEEPSKIRFRVIGIVSCSEFQVCRIYTQRLFKSYPKKYAEPDIRPLLNVDWELFLTKVRRRIGGEKLWALKKQVTVFKDNEFLGDDGDLLEHISTEYHLALLKDFQGIARQELVNFISKQSEIGRNFVYFMVTIDDRVCGSLLFQLYSDLVPRISEIFLKRCKQKHGGYLGAPIQRICKPSWIQCGGWHLKHRHVPCENYVVPHNRRGVLSMCHNGKHKDNSTQFFITLDPTPWMDYKYVAFGQLIQGEEVLKLLEDVPTYYEAPIKNIRIVLAGEFTFYPIPDAKCLEALHNYLEKESIISIIREDIIDPRDKPSVLLERRYKEGQYSAATDLQSYLPFLHLPDYLMEPYGEEEGEDYNPDPPCICDSCFGPAHEPTTQADDVSEKLIKVSSYGESKLK